jgi:hypothetical protein
MDEFAVVTVNVLRRCDRMKRVARGPVCRLHGRPDVIIGLDRYMLFIALLVLVGLELSPGVALAEGTGSLCIAPIKAPLGGEKSLANPSGGNAAHAYSVRIDGRSSFAVLHDRGTLVEGLDLDKSHTIAIYADGLRKESFRWRFDEHRAQCLLFGPLYETWRLTSLVGSEKLCACEPQR